MRHNNINRWTETFPASLLRWDGYEQTLQHTAAGRTSKTKHGCNPPQANPGQGLTAASDQPPEPLGTRCHARQRLGKQPGTGRVAHPDQETPNWRKSCTIWLQSWRAPQDILQQRWWWRTEICHFLAFLARPFRSLERTLFAQECLRVAVLFPFFSSQHQGVRLK